MLPDHWLEPAFQFIGLSLGLFFFIQLATWLSRYRHKHNYKDPGMLREPAHSLRIRLRQRLQLFFWYAFFVPILVVSWYYIFFISPIRLSGVAEDFLFTVSVAGLAIGYFAQRVLVLYTQIWRLRRIINAQTICGQSLNQLMRQGYWVLHDFPLQGGKSIVQHLVVGPAGIFVVETKDRMPHAGRKKLAVKFDGKTIHYPGWRDTNPVQRVMSQTAWLNKWLSKQLGEVVGAQMVLALPGWNVQTADWKQAIVCNPRTPKLIINATNQKRLDVTSIREVMAQLQSTMNTKVKADITGRRPAIE